jgi:predicted dehydrogenase
MMNIGILGTGFGVYHAHILKKMSQVTKIIIWGRNQSKLEQLQAELDIEMTTEIAHILEHPEIDVIDICLPTHLHKEYIIAALAHGKHVFCETPLCLNMEDVQAIKQAQLQYNKKVLVNQFMKFDPAYVNLYQAIVDQRYGPLRMLRLNRETAPHWGNLGLDTITTNLMIHELDFVTWCTNAIEEDMVQVWGIEDDTQQKAMVHTTIQGPHWESSIVANSQMPLAYPFTIGYEAYFEHAKLVFHESSTETTLDAKLVAFTQEGESSITLDTIDPFEQSIRYALDYFEQDPFTETEPINGVDEAIKSINVALMIKNKLRE